MEHNPGRTNPADAPSRRPDYYTKDQEEGEKEVKPFLRLALTLNTTQPHAPEDIKQMIRDAITEEEAEDLFDEDNPGR